MPSGTKPSTANCLDATSPHDVPKIFSFLAQPRLKFQLSETDFRRHFLKFIPLSSIFPGKKD